jgi:hypothetical protein
MAEHTYPYPAKLPAFLRPVWDRMSHDHQGDVVRFRWWLRQHVTYVRPDETEREVAD